MPNLGRYLQGQHGVRVSHAHWLLWVTRNMAWMGWLSPMLNMGLCIHNGETRMDQHSESYRCVQVHVPVANLVSRIQIADPANGCACARRWDATKPSLTWQRFMQNKNRELDRLNGVYKKLLDGAKVAAVRLLA